MLRMRCGLMTSFVAILMCCVCRFCWTAYDAYLWKGFTQRN